MTDETNPTPAPAPVPEDVATAVDRPQVAPPASGPVPSAPYRASLEVAPPFVPRASTGPVLWTFGIVLWSYVVMGQLVTTYAPGRQSLLLGEGTAVLFVFVASFVSWLVAVRRSLGASPAAGWSGRIARGLILGMLASMSWCTVTAGAAVAGKSAAKNADGSITVMLLVLSIAALLYGRRLSARPDATPPTQRARTFGRLLWTGAALLTLVALIALGASD